MSNLIDVSGAEFIPANASRILREIDELLFLLPEDGAIAYWAIRRKWAPGDKRWEMVQKGEMPNTVRHTSDIMEFLPRDCSPEQIEGFIAARWERVTDPRKQAEKQITETARINKGVAEKKREEFMVEQEEQTARTTKHDLELMMGEATTHAQIIVPTELKKPKQQVQSTKRKK